MREPLRPIELGPRPAAQAEHDPQIVRCVQSGGLDEKRPKLWAFLKRIHERPAYQRALEKGGKYELLR